MKASWFEAKIKSVQVGADGKERKVSELYLLDAMSFTEAETRIAAMMTGIIQGEFHVAGLKPSRITEVVESSHEKDDKWFRCIVEIIDVDGISGRERRQKTYFLVSGADMDSAFKNLQKAIEPYVVPCEIVSLQDSAFMDVFPYFDEENKEYHEAGTE